jgi:predicted lipid-binding transport protein (Tim44 family)
MGKQTRMEEENPSAQNPAESTKPGFIRRRVNLGGLIATVLSFGLFLQRSFEGDQDVQAMMTLSGTVVLLILVILSGTALVARIAGVARRMFIRLAAVAE